MVAGLTNVKVRILGKERTLRPVKVEFMLADEKDRKELHLTKGRKGYLTLSEWKDSKWLREYIDDPH